MKDTISQCVGLVLQYNPLSVAPGALVRANDCVVRRENIIENRRGYKELDSVASSIKQTFAFNNRVLVHNGTSIAYDDGSGDFSSSYSGTYTERTGEKIRGVESFSNFYFTTNEGVKVFTDFGSAARKAGAPRCLDPSYVLASAGAGFLADGYQCAYRALIKRTDDNDNVLFGYPSQRLWAVNASGTDDNVVLTLYLPGEAVSGDVVQVYRTEQISGTSSDTSGDEMGLIYQQELSSSDISTGYITVTDSVTDSLIGATLYTSPSQEGIRQANDRPPACNDLALYKSSFMFYANTETKERLSMTLVGATKLGSDISGDTSTGSATVINLTSTENLEAGMSVTGSGIPASTTIASVDSATQITLSQNATATATATLTFITHRTLTIGGHTYSFDSSEDTANAKIEVSRTGVAATDIDLTARSMVRVINRYASNTSIYGYYTSGPDDLPGQMLFEEQGVGGSTFTAQVSNSQISDMFFPALPESPATSVSASSSDSQRKNALYYSKADQPEAVPAFNYLLVGPANRKILKIAPLKDALIVIKEEGVYRLTGDAPSSFVITPLDLTVYCKAADSVAVLGNKVYMLSNQGVVSISENNVEVISRDIEPLLTPLMQNSSLSSYTYGISYESERSYLLTTISDKDDTSQSQTLVYNYFTRTWVRWTYGIEAGVVEPSSDVLYFAKPSDSTIYQERKSFTDDDYADPETAITIDSISGSTVQITSTVEPSRGDVILQGTTGIAISSVTAIIGGYEVALSEAPPVSWAAGAATLYPSVNMDVEYNQWSYAQPGTLKQVREVAILTDDIGANNTAIRLVSSFRSNFDAQSDEVDMEPPTGGGWGAAWGSSPWGGGDDSFGYPTLVPKNKQYCTRLFVGVKHKNAREKLSIAGLSFEFDLVSEEMGR